MMREPNEDDWAKAEASSRSIIVSVTQRWLYVRTVDHIDPHVRPGART